MPAPLAMRTCLPTLRAATVCCAECLSGDHGHRPTAHAWTANSGAMTPVLPRPGRQRKTILMPGSVCVVNPVDGCSVGPWDRTTFSMK